MTIAIPEIAGEVAGDSAGASSGGLSGLQKANAANSALPKVRTTHPYVVGLSLIVIGGFALIGSITGTLPSMLAALFVPNALIDSAGNSPTGILGDITGAITGTLPVIASLPLVP